MEARTGQTIIETFISLDADNNPVSGATFDIISIKDGLVFTGITITTTLSDPSRGIFAATWSADTIGDYNIYIKNNNTDVIFISDTVNIKPDSEFEQNIFIGL